MMGFKRIKLSENSTRKLQQFKSRTGLTPNIACRLSLGLSISENSIPSLELYTEETGQEINRHTLMGDYELELILLFVQWCNENNVPEAERSNYFLAHLNRGVELLTNRVKSLNDVAQLIE